MQQSISVIGLGYIGLPTAAMFASKRTKVIGVDVNPQIIEIINQGKIHIIEPDLENLVRLAVQTGHLHATLKPEPADVFIIAVPTPFKDGHKPDLTYIEAAAKAIAPVLKRGDLVILESTSPVGTTEMLAEWLGECRRDLSFPAQNGELADVQLAYCPERVLPGKVVHELVSNDRIIGGLTSKASAMSAKVYKTFVKGDCVVTDARTAEMCKLTENSYRDVNIAFANEISMICEKLGINVWELIKLANRHPRVNILQPGPGVGGHCIAVDPWFIVDKTPDEARLIRTAREVNQTKEHWVLDTILDAAKMIQKSSLKANLSQLKIACLGLTFKPDIDDYRESPALAVISGLAEKGCDILLVEPNLSVLPPGLSGRKVRMTDMATVAKHADLICVLVKHSLFNTASFFDDCSQKILDFVGVLGGQDRSEKPFVYQGKKVA